MDTLTIQKVDLHQRRPSIIMLPGLREGKLVLFQWTYCTKDPVCVSVFLTAKVLYTYNNVHERHVSDSCNRYARCKTH